MSIERNGESGFTMIEAVVALALVSVVLAAVGSLVATNARGAQNLEQRVALMQASRMIASAIPRGAVPLGNERAGEVFGHRWQMRVTQYAGAATSPESPFIPQRIELRVRSPSGVVASFETIRLQETGAGR
jgi:general secretion pathway protein I